VISVRALHNILDRGDRDRRDEDLRPQLVRSSPAALDGSRPALSLPKGLRKPRTEGVAQEYHGKGFNFVQGIPSTIGS